MFATIRRHQKWLWFVVILGVILPFVYFMGPSYYGTGGGGGPSRTTLGYVNGRGIDREEYLNVRQEVRLQFYMSTRTWPEENESSRQMFDMDRRIAERLVALEKVRQLNITADAAATADWIAQLFRDRERNVFNAEAYEQFKRGPLVQGRVTEADFQRFARNEICIRHLLALGGLSGTLMPPREAEQLFRREHEQVLTQIAYFSLSNHLAEVIVTPEALTSYYTNQASRYRVPEMVQVTYVRFANTNYLAEADKILAGATNLDQALDTEYRRRGPETFVDDAGKPLAAEAAKARLKEDYREGLASVEAQRRANAFAESLFTLHEQHPDRPSQLESLALSNNLPSAVTAPFSRFSSPAGLPVGRDFAEAAFGLSTNRPMALQSLVGQDGVYVIEFKRRIESFMPPFEERQNVVAADYRRTEARRLAEEAANKFAAALTNGLTQGLSFDTTCSNANVVPIRPPAFSRGTQSLAALGDRVDLNQLKAVAMDMPAGKASGVEGTRDGFMVVYVASRQPVDEARVKAELPAFVNSLRDEQRQQALMEWFQRELELAQVSGLPQSESRESSVPTGQ